MAVTGAAPLSLTKPEDSDLVSLAVINANYDIINDYAADNDARVTAVESVNTTQNSRLTALEALPGVYTPVVTTISGTTHSLVSTNASDTLRFTSGSLVTVTINDVLTNAEYVNCIQDGAGKVKFVAGSGVTLQSPVGATVQTSVQYGWCSIIRIAAGTYRLIGNLETV